MRLFFMNASMSCMSCVNMGDRDEHEQTRARRLVACTHEQPLVEGCANTRHVVVLLFFYLTINTIKS